MEALGAGLTHPVERRRQHVLAGVLLHVVEARVQSTAPSTRRPASRRPSRRARAGLVVVHDVDDAAAAKRAESWGWPPEVG